MKIATVIAAFQLCLFAFSASAADTYDATTNQLTAPAVQIGDRMYSNVVVKVERVVGVASLPKAGDVDVFDSEAGILLIPEVTVLGGNTYFNVSVTLGQVISVDGVVIPTALKNILWRQTSNSITLSNDWMSSLSFEGFASYDFDGTGRCVFQRSWTPVSA